MGGKKKEEMILVFKFPPLEEVPPSDCRHLYLGA